MKYCFDDIDKKFLEFIASSNRSLHELLCSIRNDGHVPKHVLSDFILKLAPYLEDFISDYFGISKENGLLKLQKENFDVIFECRRRFVERYALRKYPLSEIKLQNLAAISARFKNLISSDDSTQIARKLLSWLDDGDRYIEELDIAAQYCSMMVASNSSSNLFNIPRKIDLSNQLRQHKICQLQEDIVVGFDYRDREKSAESAHVQANYCLYCHEKDKDSCSTGLKEEKNGCPLEQKISEMNLLYSQGHTIAAFATAIIDNPLIAATGHRICNDCAKACIFQKQEPVNIPVIESTILTEILSLPYGVEIYYLLSCWNPLKTKDYLPHKPTGYNILVTGLGPAGFSLSYYLLQEGHNVVAIDGLRITDLGFDVNQRIKNWSEFSDKLSSRIPNGFGGVAEYGITSRWDKNNLNLVRVILERNENFRMFGSVRLGSNITINQAFAIGFDHIALCLGAGKPKYMRSSGFFLKNVRSAADFLMQLQQLAAFNPRSNSHLQIRLPAVVYGCGLTAVDSAMELVHYYPTQVENFAKNFDPKSLDKLSDENKEIAEEFLRHAKLFSECKGPLEKIKLVSELGGVSVYYHNLLTNSAAYRMNSEEIEQAIALGIKFNESVVIEDVLPDQYGCVEFIKLNDGRIKLAKTLLIAIGTEENEFADLADAFDCSSEFFKRKDGKISYFGDCNPAYHGSVVKALASSKKGYKLISQLLQNQKKSKFSSVTFADLIETKVVSSRKLSSNITELRIAANFAAENYKAGQFFRLQNYADDLGKIMKPFAITPVNIEAIDGKQVITFLIRNSGVSSKLCANLKTGEKISLMGPVGGASFIPSGQKVAIITQGLGAMMLLTTMEAMRENNCDITLICGYGAEDDMIYQEKLLGLADSFISVNLAEYDLVKHLAQKQDLLLKADYVYLLCSSKVMADISEKRDEFFKANAEIICNFNPPMQCMMKGICGQCIQKTSDNKGYIFSCSNNEMDNSKLDFQSLINRQRSSFIK